jgi:hypothetical protein
MTGEPERKEQGAVALMWTAIGFAAFGLLVGITAGLSSAQLTTTLLGLLFALIGGSIGVLLGKLNAEDRKFAGAAMATFSLCAIVGLFSGIYVRINDLLNRSAHPAVTGTAPRDPASGGGYLKSNDTDLLSYLQREVANERMTIEKACEMLGAQERDQPHR